MKPANPAKRIALRYRRAHVLAIGDRSWEIQATWRMYGKPVAPRIDHHVHFELELAQLDADWHHAIVDARSLTSGFLDGTPMTMQLHEVNLHFSAYEGEETHDGEAKFTGTVVEPLPFPHQLDDPAFVDALVRAADMADQLTLQGDEIVEHERYWYFRIHQIGMTGVVVDRRTGMAFDTSGNFPLEKVLADNEIV